MLEHRVAGLVAEAVVVVLEEVEIDHQHREARPLLDEAFDLLRQRAVVPQARQRVGLGAQLDGAMRGRVAQRDRDVRRQTA